MRDLHARLRVEGLSDEESTLLPVQLSGPTLVRMGISTWRTDARGVRACFVGPPLKARIGHSPPRAALITQHATQERDRAIASCLDEQLAAAEPAWRAPVVALPAQ